MSTVGRRQLPCLMSTSPTLGGLAQHSPVLLIPMRALSHELMRALSPQAQHGQHDLDLLVPCGTLTGHPTVMEASP